MCLFSIAIAAYDLIHPTFMRPLVHPGDMLNSTSRWIYGHSEIFIRLGCDNVGVMRDELYKNLHGVGLSFAKSPILSDKRRIGTS
jgi:hypothetical protein